MIVNPRTSTATIRKIGINGEAQPRLDGASTGLGCGKVALRYYRAARTTTFQCREVPIYFKQESVEVSIRMKLLTSVSLVLLSSAIVLAQEPNPTQAIQQANG